MDIINLIQKKYGNSCQLRSPLNKRQYNTAKKFIPTELLEILKISNGINLLKVNPDTKKIKVIGRIIYSLAEIRSLTSCYLYECGGEGVVFAGNREVDFVLKPDGKIYTYDYFSLSEKYYAESLSDYFNKF